MIEAAELLLVFNQEERPTRHAVRSALASDASVSISFDPNSGRRLHLVGGREAALEIESSLDPRERATEWLELLSGGLTFDLKGLAPGSAIALPEIEAVYDLGAVPSPLLTSAVSVGPSSHLYGGKRTLPVLRGMLSVACELVLTVPQVQALVWAPAMSVMSPKYFESVASAWLEGGPFPGLGLVSYQATMDGALQSVGLSFWLDKELRIEPELAADKVSATRLAARIVNHLMLTVSEENPQSFIAPDGQTFSLSLSSNRKFIRVSHE